jgi:hypothetical protein
MASLPSPNTSSVEAELASLYERRAAIDQVIVSLERYAQLTGRKPVRRSPAKVVLLAERRAQ